MALAAESLVDDLAMNIDESLKEVSWTLTAAEFIWSPRFSCSFIAEYADTFNTSWDRRV